MMTSKNFISSYNIILISRDLHNHLKSQGTKVKEKPQLDFRKFGLMGNIGNFLLIISPDYSTKAGDLQELPWKLL